MLGYARSALAAAEFPLAAGHMTTPGDLIEPTIWYSIGRDGRLTVNIIRAEMGQHVGTALARIVADELEVDWTKVAIIHVDTDPNWGEMVNGGSWSVRQSFPILSRAGAAGRIALIEEGAKLLGVDRGTCTARNGAVMCGSPRCRPRATAARSSRSTIPRPRPWPATSRAWHSMTRLVQRPAGLWSLPKVSWRRAEPPIW